MDKSCHACSEELDILLRAREVADELLERGLRVRVRKAMKLGTARDFDRAVGKLAAQLRARASEADDAAVRAALEVLDVDWGATTAGQRRTLIGRALEVAGRKTAAVPRAVQAVFGDAATEVVQATRDAARRGQGLTIAADFNALDKRIVEHLRSSQANFVRDEYGRRHDAFGEQARRIVAESLEAGLGREDIARDLERAPKSALTGRNSFYWEVVAGSFVSRGRSFAQLSSYAEAGIDRYIYEAVLDERTCLLPSALIETTRGFVAIGDLRVGDVVRTHRGRWRPVLATRRLHGPRRTLRISTASSTLVATANHRVLIRRNGVYGWVRADRVRPGDVLLRRPREAVETAPPDRGGPR